MPKLEPEIARSILPHPDDTHLQLIAGKMGDNWGVWLENIETGGLYYGYYVPHGAKNKLQRAMRVFAEKLERYAEPFTREEQE